MPTVSTVLVDHLDDLLDAEFNRFKWHLTDGVADGFSPISKGKLEKAKQQEVVNLMISAYGPSDAGKITGRILRKMQQNNLADQLKKNLAEVKDQEDQADQADGAVSSPAKASRAPRVHQNIKADSSGRVSANVISDGQFHGPTNLTFN
ncbi:pyrin [Colossoma macropomum]|uniref:pyrin n=1 Tax=Colossoma macropomum TaxID=42526 RepID=UPI0018655D33|nr:pyrin [Colossoma macropomum]